VVVEAGDTFLVPLDDTVPISGSMATDVEPVTLQDTVALCPAKILPGLMLKLSMEGRMPVTVMVTDLLADWDILLATRVYVVVVSGDTVLVPLKETFPIPGLMETESAPLTSHCKVASWPDVIVGEPASNDDTTGAANHLEISPCRAMPAPISAATITSATDIFAMVPLWSFIRCHNPGRSSLSCVCSWP